MRLAGSARRSGASVRVMAEFGGSFKCPGRPAGRSPHVQKTEAQRRIGVGRGVQAAVLGVLLTGALLAMVVEEAAARPGVPNRFGQEVTSGNNQLTYKWGSTTAVKAGSSAQDIAYSVRVTTDTDASRLNGECGGTLDDGCNWTLGATPRFLVSGQCGLDNAPLNNCDATYDRVRIFLLWGGADALKTPYASSVTHEIDEASPWVYAYVTLTNVVPTSGTVYDAGVLCASGSDYPTNGCRHVWTAGSSTGANGAPSAGGLNYTGTYRVVVEATYTNTNAGVPGETGTFNSDECWYQGSAYRCGAASPFNAREIGFIQVTEVPNVFEPRGGSSCTTRDQYAMLGQEVCVKLEFNASAWRSSGDIRNITQSPFGSSGDGKSPRSIECISETECFVASYSSADTFLRVQRYVVNPDNTFSPNGNEHQLVDATPQSTSSNAPHAIRMMYYPSGTYADHLVILYTQNDAAVGTSGASMYKSVWTYDHGLDAFTNVHQNRRVWDGTGNGFTFVQLSLAQGGSTGDYLAACASAASAPTGSSPQVACMVWEDITAADPASGATSGAFNSTDLNGGGVGQTDAALQAFVCGSTASNAFGVTYTTDNGVGGTETRIGRLVRTSGTWAFNAGQQVSVTGTEGTNHPAHCFHDGSRMWWFYNHFDDPLTRATPETAMRVYDAGTALSGQTAQLPHPYPAFGTGTNVPTTVMHNNSLYVLAGVAATADITGRIYDVSTGRPMSENMTLPVPNPVGTAVGPHSAGSPLRGAQNSTVILLATARDFAVVQLGYNEALNTTVSKGATVLASKVEEMNTGSKNWTFTVPATAGLDEYAVKVQTMGYHAASRQPWMTLGCTATCSAPVERQYLVSGITDPDGGTYADGGLFIEEELLIPSCTAGTTRPVYNRGESWGATCIVYDEWNATSDNGGSALMKSMSMNVTTLYASGGALASGASVELTTDANGVFTCTSCFDVSMVTSGEGVADDTYLGSSSTDESPVNRANALRVTTPLSESFGESGSYGQSPNFYDYDDDYYGTSTTKTWSTIMRGDVQRIKVTVRNARSEFVPENTEISVSVWNPTEVVESGMRLVYASNGTTVPYDYSPGGTANVGTWKYRFSAAAGEGTKGNTMGALDSTFTLASELVVVSVDIDVAGSTTDDYFNVDETIRMTLTVNHASGVGYRHLGANGVGVTNKSVKVDYYFSASGETGSFITGSASVSSGGVVTASSTDVVIPSTATDTYESSVAEVGETKDWRGVVFDSAFAANSEGFVGNYVNITALFDVDANYYVSGSSKLPAGVMMREDTVGASVELVNVRGASVPNGVTVTTRWYDDADVEWDEQTSTTTSGESARVDSEIPVSAAVGTAYFTFAVPPGAAGAMGNTLSETSAMEEYVLDNVITVESAGTNITGGDDEFKVYNRGESVEVSGCLRHADGGVFRTKAPSSDSSRTVNIQLHLNNFGVVGHYAEDSVVVGPSTCEFSTTLDVPTTAADSFNQTVARSIDADGYNWDLRVWDGASSESGVDGNNGVVADLFDVDANYYWAENVLYFTTPMMRGDTQRVNATFINARGEHVPDDTIVEVRWYDGEGALDTTYDAVTSNGNVTDAQYFIPVDWKIGPDTETGLGKTQYLISDVPSANLGNSMLETDALETDSSFIVDRVIGMSSVETNPEGSTDTYKVYNRGESVIVAGTLAHADGGPYRVKNPNGTNDRYVRNITVQLWYGTTNASYGTSAFEETMVAVDEETGAFTAILSVPSDAVDSYASTTSRAEAPSLAYSVRVYDEGGNTTSDETGNNGHTINVFSVDAGVYVDQYWQGRNDTDTNDLEFNTGTDGVMDADNDFSRIYVKNVRGDATTQFDNLSVTRTLTDPYTLAEAPTLQTTSIVGPIYRYAWGAWPLWTNRVVDYALSSADSNGNTDVYADSAATTKNGEAHHLVARTEILDTHVLRSQTQVLSVTVADSLSDYADNGLFDLSSGVIVDASIEGAWAEFEDGASSVLLSNTFTGESSPITLTRAMGAEEPTGFRDLRLTLGAGVDGRLRGTEWVSSRGGTGHHERFASIASTSEGVVWRLTNQSDWQRHGFTTGVDTASEAGSVRLAGGASAAHWSSHIRDLATESEPTEVVCTYSTGSGGGTFDLWLNASTNEFASVSSFATASSTRSSEGQSSVMMTLASLEDARFNRLAFVLTGDDAAVSECRVTYAPEAGTGLSDGMGAWRLDDLVASTVTLERPTYTLDTDATVDAVVTYTYAASSATPENESYANLRTRLLMPNETLGVKPSQVDENTLWNTTTNRTGHVTHRYTLTQIAQAGSPWAVSADTYTTTDQRANFAVGALLGEAEWFARQYSNSTRGLVAAQSHHRGEEVRLEVPIVNNPGAFQPSGGAVTDDVDDVVLTSNVLYDSVDNKFYAIWTWPTTTTAEYGTEHRPSIGYTLNGYSGFSTPPTPAKLYSNFTIGNVWHALTPTDTEEVDVLVSGAHLAWVFANQFNARGEPYDKPANYTWTHTNVSSGVIIAQNAPLNLSDPATRSSNHGSEPALNGGSTLPHIRTGYTSVAAIAPAGTWHYTAAATDGAGNNATRTETLTVNSPVTPWAFRCTGYAPEYRVGMMVNMSCYFLEKQADGQVTPVEPTRPVYIQWFAKSLNNATLTNLTTREVMNLTEFQSDDSSAQALYGARKALAWANFSIPMDLTLYLNRGIGFRVDTVYNGISIDYHGSLEIAPTQTLARITSTSEKVVGPGKETAFQVRTSLNHPVLGPIAFGPDSCRTSYETSPTACVGDQQGTVRMVIKAINPACECWATYNDPNNPVNDGTSLVNPRLVEMEKDSRYNDGAGGFAFTYTYNWTPPGALSGKTFYVWYAAEFYGQNVTWVEEFVVNTLGGADPLKVTFPAQVYLDQPVGFDIHSAYLNATARTGAASSLYVTVRGPDMTVLVSAANPDEIGDGQYIYNFTPTTRGQYRVSVTTPGNSGGWESASGTFWAEFDIMQNLTSIHGDVGGANTSLHAFVASFWATSNGTWGAWNASFVGFEGRTNSTWDAWNESFTLFNTSLRGALSLTESNLSSRLSAFEDNATERLDGWFRWLGVELVPFENVTTSTYGNRTNVTLGYWNTGRDAQLHATVSLPRFFVAGASTTVYANLSMSPTGLSREAEEAFTVRITVAGVARDGTATVTYGSDASTYAVPVVFEVEALPEGGAQSVNISLLQGSTPVAWSVAKAGVFGVPKYEERSFAGGWRFLALPNLVGDVTVEHALGAWNVDVVKWYDGAGVPHVWQRGDPLGLNNLVTVNRDMGLWVHFVTDASDAIDTGYLSAASVVLVDDADNYVAYPGVASQSPSLLADQLGTATYVVETYEPETGQYRVYDSDAEGIQTLTSMDPGKAYIIRPTGSTLWSVTNA